MHKKKPMRWLACLLCLLLLSGCSATETPTPKPTEEVIPHQVVYASFYPLYALSSLILEDVPEMELRQLVQPQDGCLRNYQLSDWDLYQIVLNSDALILGGRGLESFESAAQALGEDGPAVISLFQNLPLHNNGKLAADENASHLETENPHLYMSVRAVPQILENLYAYMTELDPYFAETYAGNLDAALKQAEALIADYDAAQEKIPTGQPVALMNEALIYPAQDLDLNVVCRIDRESGTMLYGSVLDEAIASLKSSGATVVFLEKQAPDALIRALQAQGFAPVRLDILSTGRAENGSGGYFSRMRENLAAITAALSH